MNDADRNSRSYELLAEAFGLPGSERLIKLLPMILSADEALWLAHLPATPGQLAERLRCTADEARQILNGLAAKGFVLRGEETPTGILYNRPDLGFFTDSTLANPRYEPLGSAFYDAWRELFNHEQVEQMRHLVHVEKRLLNFRVLPDEAALPAEGVKDYERASWIVDQARRIVLAHCPCRRRERACDHETEVCMWFDDLADYALGQQMARPISREEALETLARCSEAGLVHHTENLARPRVICNCCSCCCAFLRPHVVHGLDLPVATSRYQAALDADLCVDCGACIERCHFHALSEGDGCPTLHSEKCLGCGLCVTACPSGALTLAIVREVALSNDPAFGAGVSVHFDDLEE